MKKLGVIGGLGPKATAHFFNRLVDLTQADTDQDHLEMIIYNQPQIPDRTAYILGQSEEDPMPYLLARTEQLFALGCDAIYVPCNTAHYFIDQFQEEVKRHFVHMIDETAIELKKREAQHVLLWATTGTVATQLYQKALLAKGITCHVLPEDLQVKLMALIYDQIKAGKHVSDTDIEVFRAYTNDLQVDAVILGCTELSLLKEMLQLPELYVDAMECAIRACILRAGKQIKGV